MQLPEVSVIIIFYNEERFLGEAIQSVIEQTFTKWELILVNDGSTDSSPEVAKKAAKDHPGRIRYVTHSGGENRGMSASRNRGLEVASAELIAFLDGDDVWLEHKLQNQLADLEAHPEAAMTAGPLLRWLQWTGDPEAKNHEDLMGVGPKKRGRHPYAEQLVSAPTLASFMISDDYYTPTGGLIRRAAIDDVGGFVNTFTDAHEDMVALTKICLKYPVYISSDMSHLYRIHPDSYTRVASGYTEVIGARLKYLDWVEEYLRQEGISDVQVDKALRRAQLPLRHPRLHWLLDSTRRRKLVVAGGRKVGRVLIPLPLRDMLRQRWRNYVRPPEIDRSIDD